MNNAKIKALMELISEMDDGIMSKFGSNKKENLMPDKKNMDVKVTKISVVPKNSESEDPEDDTKEDNSEMMNKMSGDMEGPDLKNDPEFDKNDILNRLKKKFSGNKLNVKI